MRVATLVGQILVPHVTLFLSAALLTRDEVGRIAKLPKLLKGER